MPIKKEIDFLWTFQWMVCERKRGLPEDIDEEREEYDGDSWEVKSATSLDVKDGMSSVTIGALTTQVIEEVMWIFFWIEFEFNHFPKIIPFFEVLLNRLKDNPSL